jgi:hypothetical protein
VRVERGHEDFAVSASFPTTRRQWEGQSTREAEANDETAFGGRARVPTAGNYSEFVLKIDMGNDAMKSPEDVAVALRALAGKLDAGGCHEGSVRDLNGNTIGHWELRRES